MGSRDQWGHHCAAGVNRADKISRASLAALVTLLELGPREPQASLPQTRIGAALASMWPWSAAQNWNIRGQEYSGSDWI